MKTRLNEGKLSEIRGRTLVEFKWILVKLMRIIGKIERNWRNLAGGNSPSNMRLQVETPVSEISLEEYSLLQTSPFL